jgi:hypothetical protein
MHAMKLNHRFPGLLMALVCSSAFAQKETPNTSAPASVSNLVVLAPKLVRLQNQFEHMVPPGVSIEAREVYRKGTAGTDLQVAYNIYVKGVPPDTIFRQIQWPVDRDKPIGGFTGVTLNPEGLMICAGRTPEQCHNGTAFDAPVQFARIKPLKGEPMRSIFIAPNLKIPISMVPDPIQSEDKGCKLSAVRLTGKFELALIEGSGFPSSSIVHLHRTNADSKSIVAVIDDNGMPFTLFTAPDLVLKSDGSGAIQTAAPNSTANGASGNDTVEVTGPGCNPKITYEWGVF